MKKILLIGGNYFPEQTGIGRYNSEMMIWLSEHGYDCTVITSFPYYPQWQIQDPYKNKSRRYCTEMHGKIKVYRCPLYVPTKPSGAKRMLLDLSFSTSAFIRSVPLFFGKRFDAVITVAPPFHLGMLALFYKKLFKARFIYHIQDLQIEAARDLHMITSPMLMKSLFRLERFILYRAAVVSSISSGMIKRIQAKTDKKVLFFPNWADTKAFCPDPNKDALKAEYGFSPTDKVILYSGAIGEKQGLKIVLEVADEMRHNQHVKFVICGSGPYKTHLQNIAAELGLQNVSFFPLQPTEKMNAFLNMADVHLVIQKADASDLVMPSKLSNILAVGGVALVTANPDSVLYDDISKNNMGILVAAESKDALKEGIEKGISEDCQIIKANARAYAEFNLNIDKVLERFTRDAHI